MSSQYGELRPTNGWDRLASLGHPTNFNGFRVLASSLHRRRSTVVNQTLHDVWPSAGLVHNIYIFGGSCPLTEFCEVQNSLCVSLAFSYKLIGSVTARQSSSGRQPNFAACYKEWNDGTFPPRHFEQRAPPIFRGRPWRWALAHILVLCLLMLVQGRF